MLWSNVQQDDGADCVAQEDHSTAHVANSASLILRDGATLIDEAVRLTIAGMPTRSGSWRTHDDGRAAPGTSVRTARARRCRFARSYGRGVMRLHSTLMAVGRCYTTDAAGDRAALELGRVESVLAGSFCTIFGQSPADRFADIFDQVAYVAEHMVKDHIFEDGNKRTSLVFALSVLRFAGTPVVLSDGPEPKDNQYYAWIQDLVSSRRTTSELAEELRRGCVVGSGDPSRV